MSPTVFVLERPWIAPLVWGLLHSADYHLTLVGARARRARAHEVIRVDGSYELNPLFQEAVDRGRWLSPRFLVTLVGMGVVLYLIAALCPGEEVGFGLGLLLGVVVFTRVAVIGRHLQNIWLYRRMARRPAAVTGAVSYDRPTIYGLSAFTYGHFALLLGVAAAVAPDPWILGGAGGNGLIAVLSMVLGARAKPSGA
jgi:hypothetical protein